MSQWLRALYAPVLLRTDFRQAAWAVSRGQVLTWLAIAVGLDLFVQHLTATLVLWSAAASFLAFALVALPARLAFALAGLYCVQALVSLPLWFLAQNLAHSGASGVWVGYVLTVSWQVWCLVALLALVLRYIRTPKREMASAEGA